MAILDMERIMLYNVYNGWREKLYNMTESQETGKNALYGVFVIRYIKSCGTPKNAVQRIYIKYGNTKNLNLYAVDGQHKKPHTYIKQREHFVKNMSCGYNSVTVIRLRLTPPSPRAIMGVQ